MLESITEEIKRERKRGVAQSLALRRRQLEAVQAMRREMAPKAMVCVSVLIAAALSHAGSAHGAGLSRTIPPDAHRRQSRWCSGCCWG